MTKRDKPAMSEEEFEKAIKELAQKENYVCSMVRQFPRTEKPSMNQA